MFNCYVQHKRVSWDVVMMGTIKFSPFSKVRAHEDGGIWWDGSLRFKKKNQNGFAFNNNTTSVELTESECDEKRFKRRLYSSVIIKNYFS